MTEVDHGALAQKVAEEHLENCHAANDGWGGEVGESPASAPFCGCTTCTVREVLHAAWPHLMNAAREEIPR